MIVFGVNLNPERKQATYDAINNELKNILRNNYFNLKVTGYSVGQSIHTIFFRGENGFNPYLKLIEVLGRNNCSLGDNTFVELHGHAEVEYNSNHSEIKSVELKCLHYKLYDDKNNVEYLGRFSKTDFNDDMKNYLNQKIKTKISNSDGGSKYIYGNKKCVQK